MKTNSKADKESPSNKRNHVQSAIFFVFLYFCILSAANAQINLAGDWQFKLDSEKKGISENWVTKSFKEKINLPGSIQNQKFGNDVDVNTPWVTKHSVNMDNYPSWYTHPKFDKYKTPDNFKFPYWLQPDKHYIGWAWFKKDFEISDEEDGKDFQLFLERCHWETKVWIDNKEVGSLNSLATPHRYTIKNLSSGKHTLTILVDNTLKIDVGLNAHSVSDHTQTNWNGIIGNMSLIPEQLQKISHIDVFPSIENRKAETIIQFENKSEKTFKGKLTASISLFNSSNDISIPSQEVEISLSAGQNDEKFSFNLGEQVYRWDEFTPNLYRLQLILKDKDGNTLSKSETTFGVRDIKTKETQFILNNRPLFIRGNLDCCVFPNTGYPDTDVESWRRIYRVQKDFGINTVRFHSWCPPEAAFTAADLEGMYLQPENVVWVYAANQNQKDFIKSEAKRILKEYGNHPSFLFFGYGNEAGVPPEFMEELLAEWKKDKRRLYTGAANANITESADYSIAISYPKHRENKHYLDSFRLRYQEGWPPIPRNTYFNSFPPSTNRDYQIPVKNYGKPLIAHETVQRCTYPDLNSRCNYNGVLYPSYLDIAEDQLKENNMYHQLDNFIQASGKWQVQSFKEEIEAHLRTPGFGGFHLLSLNDFTGQGAALVGVVDALWNNKGYIIPAEFKRFCNDVVPLFRMTKRVWLNNETFEGKFEIANYGKEPLKNTRFRWFIKDKKGIIKFSDQFIKTEIPLGNAIDLEEISVDLAQLESPAKYNIEIQIEGTSYINDWDFWVFPSENKAVEEKGVVICTKLKEAVIAAEKGGNVLFIPEPKNILGELPPCFTGIYWNAPWTNVGESSTLGILVDPDHDLFKSFPTDFHSNWHWYDLLVQTSPMMLDSLPKELFPVVQLIDDYHQNRKLGVVFEAKVGKGKMVVCSIDFQKKQESPVIRQFRKSLFEYMNSEKFNPLTEINESQLKDVIKN